MVESTPSGVSPRHSSTAAAARRHPREASILYVYAVVGVHLFAGVDPGNWGSLPRAWLTLFEILTLEGWVDLMNASLAATNWAWIYYVSFVVLAVFVVVNLFIEIVINNLEAAKRDEDVPTDPRTGTLAARRAGIRAQLEAVEAALRTERNAARR